MTEIPRPALLLGLAGVLPFGWGVLTMQIDALSHFTLAFAGSRFIGPSVQLFYGAVILSFMSGVLWGFSTNSKGKFSIVGYSLSVLPALWAFFSVGDRPEQTGQNLIIGFLGLLVIDWFFWSRSFTPIWWMKLRIFLTFLVIPLLAVGVYL
jgi:hypothetical protein